MQPSDTITPILRRFVRNDIICLRASCVRAVTTGQILEIAANVEKRYLALFMTHPFVEFTVETRGALCLNTSVLTMEKPEDCLN
jgi:hypothetical protein